jgi:methyl-accepting chemotaxis protein
MNYSLTIKQQQQGQPHLLTLSGHLTIKNSFALHAELLEKLLHAVIPDIKSTAVLINQIASSSTEQTLAIGQIDAAIEKLTSINQQNAALAEELAASSEELSGQAQGLKESVSIFKIAQEQPAGQAMPPKVPGYAATKQLLRPQPEPVA